MKHNSQNTNAFLIHICAFTGILFPFGHIITPLIIWQTLKDRSPYLDEQGKDAVNFNISYTLYAFLTNLFFDNFISWTVFRASHFLENYSVDIRVGRFDTSNLGFTETIIYLIAIALIIIAAVKAKEGENYTYPFTIKFIK